MAEAAGLTLGFGAGADRIIKRLARAGWCNLGSDVTMGGCQGLRGAFISSSNPHPKSLLRCVGPRQEGRRKQEESYISHTLGT
jgi:hypothetical protein